VFRAVCNLVGQTFADAQAEQHRSLNDESQRFDWETAAVLITAAFALTWREYSTNAGLWSIPNLVLPSAMADSLKAWTAAAENREVVRLSGWVFAQTLAYLAAPMICCLLIRKSPANYGWKLQGATQLWPFYALLFGLILPVIVFVSQTPMFQRTYPFYGLREGESVWPRLIVWELLYAWQFIVLEFFFRGFLVHGLKRRFGFYSVFVMMVPYCMIHFGKPYPETVGAIIAGIALGIMSLRTGSIWLGAALHIAVAWSMDFAALYTSSRL